VIALFGMQGGIFEHLVDMTLWADSHVLLAEVFDVRIDVGVLLRQNISI
jgi:hypothetical protein